MPDFAASRADEFARRAVLLIGTEEEGDMRVFRYVRPESLDLRLRGRRCREELEVDQN